MPLLDHRIVEYAAQIPDVLKRRAGAIKWPLREILARNVPPRLTERPKMGFNPPMSRWLLGPLRNWAEALLAEDRLQREGFFEASELRRIWDEHKQGKRNHSYNLWAVLMFQAWHESF